MGLRRRPEPLTSAATRLRTEATLVLEDSGARTTFLLFASDQIGQRHRCKVIEHFGVQRRPQVVGHAAVLVVTVFAAAALGGIELLVDGANDLGHRHQFKRLGDAVAAAGAAHAVHQLVATQLAEQLF